MVRQIKMNVRVAVVIHKPSRSPITPLYRPVYVVSQPACFMLPACHFKPASER